MTLLHKKRSATSNVHSPDEATLDQVLSRITALAPMIARHAPEIEHRALSAVAALRGHATSYGFELMTRPMASAGTAAEGLGTRSGKHLRRACLLAIDQCHIVISLALGVGGPRGDWVQATRLHSICVVHPSAAWASWASLDRYGCNTIQQSEMVQ